MKPVGLSVLGADVFTPAEEKHLDGRIGVLFCFFFLGSLQEQKYSFKSFIFMFVKRCFGFFSSLSRNAILNLKAPLRVSSSVQT